MWCVWISVSRPCEKRVLVIRECGRTESAGEQSVGAKMPVVYGLHSIWGMCMRIKLLIFSSLPSSIATSGCQG